jgi:hypothetical protein
MTGESKDLGEEGEDQQFTPTDWDWVMFLSGEINAVKTRSDTFRTVCIAIESLCVVVMIAFLGILVSNLDVPNSDIIIPIIIWIPSAIIIFMGYRLYQDYNKYMHEDKKMVERLEKCRKDIFNRLNDPNKILECYLNPVGKKAIKTNR